MRRFVTLWIHPPAARGRAVARGLALALVAPALLLIAAACTDAEDEGSAPAPAPTPAATAPPAPTPAPTPTPTRSPAASLQGVQEINFTDAGIVGPVIDHFGGGEVLPSRIIYTDMTGDGAQEAVVIVESGGTMGDIGVAIFTIRDGQPEVVQFIDAAGRVEVEFAEVGFGVLVTLEPIYAPGDPQSSPSKLREVFYEWDGSELVVATEQERDNPDAR